MPRQHQPHPAPRLAGFSLFTEGWIEPVDVRRRSGIAVIEGRRDGSFTQVLGDEVEVVPDQRIHRLIQGFGASSLLSKKPI